MALWKKTGALEKLTDKMAGAFKGKERGFVILTVILFVVLSSVTGLIIPLFALVPLFAAVLFAMIMISLQLWLQQLDHYLLVQLLQLMVLILLDILKTF